MPNNTAEWSIRNNGRKNCGESDSAGIRIKGENNRIRVEGTQEQKELIKKIVTESFTVVEQKALVRKGELVIHIECAFGNAAIYEGKEDGVSYKIHIDPFYLFDGDSLLHELVHHSRMVDESRDNILLRTRSRSYEVVKVSRKDWSLEEAATTLEALTRQDDNVRPVIPGYYGRVFVSKGRNPFRVIKSDRELMTGSAEPGSKGMKGARAKEAVETRFFDSAISNLVLVEYGSRSAKDRLKELERQME